MKRITLLGLIACFTLSACSKNPLMKKTPEAAARLLCAASVSAMKDMGNKEPFASSRYLHCMKHETDAAFDCEALYQHMSTALAATGLNVSANQLKDANFFESVRDDMAFYLTISK